MGYEEEDRLLFPSSVFTESFTEAAATATTPGSGSEQTKARQLSDGQARKRRLSDGQARFLELSFGKERKLETPRKVQLAAELGLDAKQVAVWFQNRRARHKSKLMEEEFSSLRAAHDAAVLHNCHLETEVVGQCTTPSRRRRPPTSSPT
ncbi:Homeobox-leucine zipper protein HOX12 [Zea mays]|uniref:Homeobox-leucine zipper protein n=1 Tax=Zea mays TaxID=4577 RepID=A0A3L6DF67_MAIZE|nr:Homeobox-leucine zipper protein HOX12 [Zea mays]